MKLQDEILPLTKDTLEKDARVRLNMVKYHESGVTIQLQDDWEYYVAPLVKNIKWQKKILGRYYRKYILCYIRLDNNNLLKLIEEKLSQTLQKKAYKQIKLPKKGTLESLLEKLEQKGFEVGIFISHSNSLFTKTSNYSGLFRLENILRTNRNTSVHFFTEVDITNPKYNELTDKCSSLLTHIHKYPLYSKIDTSQFIQYLTFNWNMKLQNSLKNEIIETTGGYLWLVSHVIRYLRDKPEATIKEAFHDDILINKLEIIWNKLTNTEKDMLAKIQNRMLKKTDLNSHEFQYLSRINMILGQNGKYSLGIPLLSLIIQKEQSLDDIEYSGNSIIFRKTDITNLFSPHQRILLKVLLNQKKQIVTREQIAKAIWISNWQDKYSDWAIDRIVHRLRKTFKSLSINPQLIKTAKRKGIIFG